MVGSILLGRIGNCLIMTVINIPLELRLKAAETLLMEADEIIGLLYADEVELHPLLEEMRTNFSRRADIWWRTIFAPDHLTLEALPKSYGLDHIPSLEEIIKESEDS